MRTTASGRAQDARTGAVQALDSQPQRKYPRHGPYDYSAALAAVAKVCKYSKSQAGAAIDIATRCGMNAEPCPGGLVNIWFRQGQGWTLEVRSGHVPLSGG